MIDREFSAVEAARHLQKQLCDGRSYDDLLERMRRGLTKLYAIPHHRYGAAAWYYESDLDAFVSFELKRLKPKTSAFVVERVSGEIGSWLKPVRRLSPHRVT